MSELNTWRGFDHGALLSAISSDLRQAGWVDDPPKSEEESNALQFAGDVLKRTLYKKWSSESEIAQTRALLTFLEANYLSEKWTPGPGLVESETFNRLVWELDKFFHKGPDLLVSSYHDLWENGYTGPGSSIGATGASYYAKFGWSRLSTTSEDLYISYLKYVSDKPTLAEAESLRSQELGTLSVTDTSRVSFAPKNADTARLICTEPSINMFLQLGFKTILDKRMEEVWGVDMEDQPEINRLLAKVGSRDGSFGTIDLKSASDCISLRLCELVLPSWVFNLVKDLRCSHALVGDYGLRRELGMMSTMGNGFTFPMMTIILSCAVRAVYHTLGLPIQETLRVWETDKIYHQPRAYNVHGNWAVFGDDIIVRREAYDSVVAFLEQLGFTVNITKSFNQGPFRESCGHDYYHGLNVRGVYLKRLRSLQDLAVAVNSLNDWTTQTGIRLCSSVAYLMSLFRDDVVRYVPFSMPHDSGIRVPYCSLPILGLTTTRRGGRWKWKMCFRAWSAVQQAIKFGDGVVITPSSCRRLGYNAHALLNSLLLGEVRDGQIYVRHNNVSLYRTQWHITHDWDYVPPSYWFNHRCDWRRFSSAVCDNLNLSYTEN